MFASKTGSLRSAMAALVLTLVPQALPGDSQIRFSGTPAELTISEVSERTLRLQLSPLDSQGQPVPAPPSTSLVPFSTKVKFRARDLPAPRSVRAGNWAVRIETEPSGLRIHFSGSAGSQSLAIGSGSNAPIDFRTLAPVLGLGEGAQQFDRREAFYPMINGQLSPSLATHGATIPVPFVIGTDGWAMFLQQPWCQIDLRDGMGKFVRPPNSMGTDALDVFLIDAPEPADALAEYIRLTGHPVMPPKWALGYIQSHRTLAGPEDPIQIAQTFREKELPCDALIYLGTGYCPAGWNTGHGSLDFNPKTFPRPKESIDTLHQLNFKVVVHINAAPKNMFGLSMAEPSDSPVHIHNYWARHKELITLGVDAWWPDDGDELPIESRLARHRCYYEGPLQDLPNLRPWSLHRNGYAGTARYGGWIWSGDTESRWATLAAHVPVGLNHSLSLTPFWGTDIGGFVPTPELTGELYTRWFQFAAFNPLFRSHGRTWHLRLPWGWNTGEFGPIEAREGPDASELHNTEVEPICRKYLELRYRLLPYNYTLMRDSCDTGLPAMRALWLHYPHDPETVKLGDEYLWGRDLLVAPVVEKGAHSRHLYLPPGDWYDWWTGEKLAGKRWLDRPVDLATMPLYARAGAIFPLDPVRQYTAQPVNEPTTLRIYPGADGEFTIYDDDGQSLGYRTGADSKMAWIRIRWNDKARRLTLERDARMKAWPGGIRRFTAEIAGQNAIPAHLEFNGRKTRVRL
jgi:alpha-glucosidase/alpha-D-xyloside xylohydrolase